MSLHLSDLTGQLLGAAALLAALGVIAATIRGGWRLSRRFYFLVDQLVGDEHAEPPRTGVLTRLDRVVAGQQVMATDLGAMRQALEATQAEYRGHLDGHAPKMPATTLRRPGRQR